MKKFLLLFAALLTLGLTTRAADGDEFTVDNLKYLVLSETEHKVSLIGYIEQPEGDLSIPAEVTNNGNSYSVTEIGESAFHYYCTGLTSVTIPNSVTAIGKSAFHFCTGLTSVTIPNSVTEIGSGAFSECYGLTSVTIPNSVTGIGESAFSLCKSMQEIIVEIGNKNYTSIDGVLYDFHITELITYPAGKEGAFDIPNSVTAIGDWAFASCTGLTSVTIPNSVTEIGKYAFDRCSGLTSVTIPNSVTAIGEGAFLFCKSLQEIVVENGNKNYTSIDGVLYDSQITELITYPAGKEGAFDIPNSVTTIGGIAFYYCSGLTSVTIPNSVTNIGNAAFSVCESLTSVTIPNSVTNIGDWAFGGCSGLTTIMSRPTTPPACYSRTFGNVPQSAVVYIPKGTLNEYAAAEGWNYFTDFRETEDSGIEGVEAGSDTASAEFFRLNGMRVKGGALAPGVYLKRQGGNVTKVLVK